MRSPNAGAQHGTEPLCLSFFLSFFAAADTGQSEHFNISKSATKDAGKNPFVMSLAVQFITDGALSHYKSGNRFKGSAFCVRACVCERNQFRDIINLQPRMFFRGRVFEVELTVADSN